MSRTVRTVAAASLGIAAAAAARRDHEIAVHEDSERARREVEERNARRLEALEAELEAAKRTMQEMQSRDLRVIVERTAGSTKATMHAKELLAMTKELSKLRQEDADKATRIQELERALQAEKAAATSR